MVRKGALLDPDVGLSLPFLATYQVRGPAWPEATGAAHRTAKSRTVLRIHGRDGVVGMARPSSKAADRL
jgi:hypothetical protein